MAFIKYFFLYAFLFHCCFADLPNDTVYLTWQRDPTTTMTIQWLSSPDDLSTKIFFRHHEEDRWQEMEGFAFKFPHSPHYLIHRVELTGLKPGSAYFFQFPQENQQYQFQTMPADLSHPLRFVVGGDMYHDEIHYMTDMCKEAMKKNPAFALVGGDIAYAVGSPRSPQNIERWIQWLKAWRSSMLTSQMQLIPVIPAIGNHDLPGHYNQTPEQAKVFSALFPMPGKRIYNVLDFSDYLSIWFLDSGHANPVDGHQSQWLKSTLEDRQDARHRFAIYHVPAYPCIRDFNNPYSSAIRKNWVPLFEKGGLHTAFEHHDHAYKRTHPLLNNKIDHKGVMYLGDGAWGVEKARSMKSHKMPPFFAKFASKRHLTAVTLTPNYQHYLTFDHEGNKIDEHSRLLLPALPKEEPVLQEAI